MLLALKTDPTAFTASYEEYSLNNDMWWNSYMSSYLYSSTSKMLFAYVDNKVAGMIGIVYNNPERMNHIVNIYWFYVKKEFRKSGVGSALLNKAHQEIQKATGIIKINLTVSSGQENAIRLYQKLGYEIVGTEKDHLKIDGNFYDFITMEKFL